MKILAFSDLHLSHRAAAELVEASGEADLVIGAGDFCTGREGLTEALEMLAGITAPMVVVPGNNESAGELREAVREGITVLHGQGVEIAGLTLYGVGGGVPVTPFGDWSWDLTEVEAEALLEPCAQADILVLHSPPKGVADSTSSGQSVGSTAIRDAIARIQPRLAVCGHIHDAWGQEGTIGNARVVNLGPRPNWFELAGQE
ncbi:Predicted phosphoesterase [Salinihabitans flavidus]|uniref:Predicted phosphoesterase n=1 Tax=Salinihabitans flavidus TaxID=569882 RepID=A0A1H8S7Z4_9RHOB|nr:metallophosphoesterase family protein [Salinihabitans flavidus]SEO74840.1 Predicted phosphoesterase [Salinihabitans flavidus]